MTTTTTAAELIAQAKQQIRNLTVDEVAHLDGGFVAWTDAGLDSHTG